MKIIILLVLLIIILNFGLKMENKFIINQNLLKMHMIIL